MIGYDIEAHDYGDGKRYPAELRLRDVLTIHGSEFKDAALIVASPPCQEYSYMAMPWSRAKAIAAEYRIGKRDVKKLTALFDACFRIQREAIEAAGHFIPLVVENVRGAQPWVGRARWNYGSFYLWGDVPALMPITLPRSVKKREARNFHAFENGMGSSPAFNGAEHEANVQRYEEMKSAGVKVGDRNRNGKWTSSFADHIKNDGGGSWDRSRPSHTTDHSWKTNGHVNKRDGYNHTLHLTNQAESDGVKHGGDCFNDPSWPGKQGGVKQPGIGGLRENGKGDAWFQNGAARHGSKSKSRKAASAMIAKIPLPLAQWIAKAWKPREAVCESR